MPTVTVATLYIKNDFKLPLWLNDSYVVVDSMYDYTIIERKAKYDANKNHTKSFEMVSSIYIVPGFWWF